MIVLMLLLVACESPAAPASESGSKAAPSASAATPSAPTLEGPDVDSTPTAGAGSLTPEPTRTPGVTFVVDSTADAPDASNDGVCDDGSGNCTLRAAIMQSSVLDVVAITLPPGEYKLSIEPPDTDIDHGAFGDLHLRGDITINGAGKDATIIDGGRIDRVFEIFEGSSVRISGVTIQNGKAAPVGRTFGGGGIANRGTLTLTDTRVNVNWAPDGGGIVNEGSLNIYNSTISANGAAVGGGVVNEGKLDINDSRISGNKADKGGGGIYNRKGGTLTVTDGTVTGNSAPLGGGIFNVSKLDITDSRISDNTAEKGGGGILNSEGKVTLTGSTVRGNSAPQYADILNQDGSVRTITTKAGAGSPGPATGALTDISELDQLDLTQPLIIKGLASGDFRVLRLSEDKVHTHIAGMNQVFEVGCPMLYDRSITTVATNRVIYGKDGKGLQRGLEQSLTALGQAFSSGSMEDIFQAVSAPANRLDINISNAQKDALILLNAGGCDSPLVVTFYSNMGKFVKSPYATTATVPLNESKVNALWWGALRTIYQVPSAKRELVNRQVYELIESGQEVITCTYGPSDPVKQVGFQGWDFWYESVPDNIIDMLSTVPNDTHPMRTLGLNSITECPESPEAAQRIRRAGMIP